MQVGASLQYGATCSRHRILLVRVTPRRRSRVRRLQPVVLARSVSVHPVIAILALITFQQWLGVIGMVIAIPAAGVLVMMISTLYKSLKAFKVI